MAKGFDVVIFERNYYLENDDTWDEDAEIKEQRKAYDAWFSPNAAKARSKALYREDALAELKDGHWKKPYFLKAVSEFIAHARRERAVIKVVVNEVYKKATIEINTMLLGFCDDEFEQLVKKYACEPFIGVDGGRFFCRLVFDLNREEA